MLFIEWIKNYKKNKEEDKRKEEENTIKDMIRLINYKGISKYYKFYDIEEERADLFQIKKNKSGFDSKLSSYPALNNDFFNIKLYKLLSHLAVDNNLYNDFFNYEFNPNGLTEESLFLDLINHINYISIENFKILANLVPSEKWLEFKQNDKNQFITPIYKFLLIQENGEHSLLNLLEHNKELKKNLFNLESPILRVFKEDAYFMNIISGLIKNIDKLNDDKNLNKKDKKNLNKMNNELDYYLKEIIIKEDKKYNYLTNYQIVNSLKLLLKDKERINTIIDNDIFKSNIIEVLPELLSLYNDSKDDFYLELMRKIIKNKNLPVSKFELDFFNNDLSNKLLSHTCEMWLDNFIEEENKLINFLFLAVKLLNNNESNLKNLEIFIDKYKESFYEKEKLLPDVINLFLLDSILDSPTLIEKFLSNKEYLEYFKKNSISINTLMYRENENFYFMNKLLDLHPNYVFTEKNIELLKEFDLDPFLKDDKNQSLFDKADGDLKYIISNTYLKEKAEYEKSILTEINTNDNIKHIKKRL